MPGLPDASLTENDRAAARPYADQPAPVASRPPVWLVISFAAAILAGLLAGYTSGTSLGERIARAVFHAAAFAYVVTSIADMLEHHRLERLATGKWWAMTVVPIGESLNHLATLGTLVAFLTLARPPPDPLEVRDYFVLAAPAIFLALGWRDEVVYHRRRSTHREDMLHTVSHLAAGVMLAGAIASKMVRW